MIIINILHVMYCTGMLYEDGMKEACITVIVNHGMGVHINSANTTRSILLPLVFTQCCTIDLVIILLLGVFLLSFNPFLVNFID